MENKQQIVAIFLIILYYKAMGPWTQTLLPCYIELKHTDFVVIWCQSMIVLSFCSRFTVYLASVCA